MTNVTALPVPFAQQLAQGERRDLFITFSLQTGESETAIYAVGIAGFPLKLEDGLFMLQCMERLSTDFSWQMAPGNQLRSYRTQSSWAVICRSWIFTWADGTAVTHVE